MGGQTALNCALDLVRHGVLAKHKVELIGANEHAIEKSRRSSEIQASHGIHWS